MLFPAEIAPLAAANAQHRGRRENQEDAFGFSSFSDPAFIAHGGYVSVVSDGMGGLEHGALASSAAVRGFLAAYRQKNRGESVLDALQRSAQTANDEVFRLAQNLGAVDQTGATLVAAAVRGNRLDWVGIGDSRLYHYGRGVFRQVTEDHNFRVVLNEQVQQGVISPSEAAVHPQANALTSYLGREQIPLVCSSATGSITLKKGDWIVLCSDGLSGTLDDRAIEKELHGTAQQAVERLLLRALSRDLAHQDNITLLVLRYGSDGVSIAARRQRTSVRRTYGLALLGAVALSAVSLLAYLVLPPVAKDETRAAAPTLIADPVAVAAAPKPADATRPVPGNAEAIAVPATVPPVKAAGDAKPNGSKVPTDANREKGKAASALKTKGAPEASAAVAAKKTTAPPGHEDKPDSATAPGKKTVAETNDKKPGGDDGAVAPKHPGDPASEAPKPPPANLDGAGAGS